MKWISVKDRLPEQLKIVVISTRKDYYLGYLTLSNIFVSCANHEAVFDVTHWMELEPPHDN